MTTECPDLADGPLDTTFRPRTDHGLNLPEGTVVLSAKFGRQRADIWLEAGPRQIWNRDAEGRTVQIGELDHQVWRISAGYGSIASCEKVAKFRAEEIAREVWGLPPKPPAHSVTGREVADDMAILNRQNAEAIALHRDWEARLAHRPEPEPGF
ncbi:hypothetical protein [Paracoccus sp. ME4]|uniref:hypothetical protein n=1 Tax=Paracoccus sp. ME4 TaxID=3138066 RepID=UPI00398AF2DF